MSFPTLSRNVWLLSIAHIFSFAGASVTFFLGGIIGAQLAPSLSWAIRLCLNPLNMAFYY